MIKNRIEEKLTATFSPTYLKVIDESHFHLGHGNFLTDKDTHFSVVLISPLFRGVGRIHRHQQVYACLDEELKNGIHALALKVLCPEEGESLAEV